MKTMFCCLGALGLVGAVSAPHVVADNSTNIFEPNSSQVISDEDSTAGRSVQATASSGWWSARLNVTSNTGVYHSYLSLFCDDGESPALQKNNATNTRNGDLSLSCRTGWFDQGFYTVFVD